MHVKVHSQVLKIHMLKTETQKKPSYLFVYTLYTIHLKQMWTASTSAQDGKQRNKCIWWKNHEELQRFSGGAWKMIVEFLNRHFRTHAELKEKGEQFFLFLSFLSFLPLFSPWKVSQWTDKYRFTIWPAYMQWICVSDCDCVCAIHAIAPPSPTPPPSISLCVCLSDLQARISFCVCLMCASMFIKQRWAWHEHTHTHIRARIIPTSTNHFYISSLAFTLSLTLFLFIYCLGTRLALSFHIFTHARTQYIRVQTGRKKNKIE